MSYSRSEFLGIIGDEIVNAGVEGKAALGMAAELAMGATTAEEAVHIIRNVFCLLTRGRTIDELVEE